MLKISSIKIAIIGAILLLLTCQGLFAMQASPDAFEIRQPDGKKIRLHIRGDERFNWYEDTDGYTVVRDRGRYSYARLDQNKNLKPTSLTVGVDNPKAAGLKKKILPPVEIRRSFRPSLMSGAGSATPPAAVSPSGMVKNLVVLCMFSDHTLGVHTRDAGDYDILFNQIGGDPTLAPTGSVKDLYLENSYGVMTLESTVTAWVVLPETEAYYADKDDGLGTYPKNAQRMVEDALDLVDPLVDFLQFDTDGDDYIDSIDIIHSGYAAETGGGGGDWIWSHRWGISTWTSDEGIKVSDYHTEPALWGQSGTAIVRLGVIAHETGHFFGLPDLYDTDGSGEGIGSWGMMANSWGFDSTQLHPPHFSAPSKIELGWVTPTVIDTPGTYLIDQVETNAQVYRIDHGYPSNEYLLIENRQPVGIETVIPQGGLCIYHIDEAADYDTEGYPGQGGWPENGNHYRIAIMQADGNYNLERGNNRGDSGDAYHASGVSEISPVTTPNTDAYQSGNIVVTNNLITGISASAAAMSFVYNNGTAPLPPHAADINIKTPYDTPVVIALQATDDGLPDPPAALNYTITSLPNQGILTDPNGADIVSVPYTLANNADSVTYTPGGGCWATAIFTFIANDGGTSPDGGDSNQATVSVDVVDIIYSAYMDTDPGWTLEDKWQWGTPAGSGGSYGNPDPTSGHTGSNVIGFNLSGNYKKIRSTKWTTTPAIDCTGKTNVIMEFYRWLNVEVSTYDHAYIEVSNDNSIWNTIWQNTDEVTDSSWTLQSFDISAIADNEPTVYVRWGMGITDARWHYSGWNIDDFELYGANPPALIGDFEPDCDIDTDDLSILLSHWLEQCGNCEGTDLSTNGKIDLEDFALFAQIWMQ